MKNSKSFHIVFFIVVIAALGYVFLSSQDDIQEVDYDDVHYHAAFNILVDGELQDYGDIEYMHISPCNVGYEDEEHDFSDVTDRVHLHNFIGNVIHVHDEGVTWRNLFQSLGIEDLLADREVYVYGPTTDSLDEVIEEYEKVVISIGQELPMGDMKQYIVSQSVIDEAEAQLESCGSKS